MFTKKGSKVILGFAVAATMFAQLAPIAQAQGDVDFIDADKPGVEQNVTPLVRFSDLPAPAEESPEMNFEAEVADVAPELVYQGNSPEELADTMEGEFAESEEKASPPAMNHQIFLPIAQSANGNSEEEGTVNAASASSSSSSTNVQARGDFNGDGFGDLAIGMPYEDNGTIINSGQVQVLYGTAAGLDKLNDEIWVQHHPDMQDLSENNDYFGASLAVGDINNDGYDDLAVGVPGEDVGSLTDAGAIQMIYGSANGLTTNGNQFLHQDSSQIKGKAEKYDRFGKTLAIGDFNNDAYDDLAIGVPHEDTGWWGRHNDAGAVHVIRGSYYGLNIYRNSIWTQGTSGIAGDEESGDRFGDALAAGNFDNRNGDDLAIGVPGEDHSSKDNAGVVNLIYSKVSVGLHADNNVMMHQNSYGIADKAETNDLFGSSLSTGDYNGDSYDDLAVGIPREGLVLFGTNVVEAGAVQVIYGTIAGLKYPGNQFLTQAYPGVINHPQAYERFGESVASGDFNGDGFQDLVIGVPNQSISNHAATGAAHILYGSSSRISTVNDKFWYQSYPGIAGTPRTGNNFGHAFSINDFNGDGYDDIMVAVPNANVGNATNAGAVVVVYNVGYGYWSEEIHQDTWGINGIAETNDKMSYTDHQ